MTLNPRVPCIICKLHRFNLLIPTGSILRLAHPANETGISRYVADYVRDNADYMYRQHVTYIMITGSLPLILED